MSLTTSILAVLRYAGYTVTISHDKDAVELRAVKDGQTWVVRATDEYLAACELAQRCGFDLE